MVDDDAAADLLTAALRIFGYMEIFVMFAIHFYFSFLNLTELDPRSYYDLAGLLAVFIAGFGFMVISGKKKIRLALRRSEWLLHLSIVIVSILLIELTRSDVIPYSGVPLALRYFLWVVYWGLLLLAVGTMNLDKMSIGLMLRDGSRRMHVIAAFVVVWVVFLLLLQPLRNPGTMWVVSSVFHGLLVAISRIANFTKVDWLLKDAPRRFGGNSPYRPDLKSYNPLKHRNKIRIFFISFALINAWASRGNLLIQQGILRGDPAYFLLIFTNPLFYVGAILAFVVEPLNVSIIGDGMASVVVILGINGIYTLNPFALGYCVAVMIFMFSDSDASSTMFLQFLFPVMLFLGFMIMLGAQDVYVFTGTVLFEILEICLYVFLGLRLIMDLTYHALQLTLWKKTNRQDDKKSKDSKRSSSEAQITRPGNKKLAYGLVAVFIAILCSPMLIAVISANGTIYVHKGSERLEVATPSGICNTPRDFENFERLQALGVHQIRSDFTWDYIEPTNDTWNWAKYDWLTSNAPLYDINITALLVYGNDAITGNDLKYVPPDAIDDFLDYVNHTVRRYVDDVSAWEVWNEPNHWDWWKGTNAEFFRFFNETRKLLIDLRNELNADFKIVCSSTAFSWPSFYKQMWEANVMAGVDALSVHPYNAMYKESIVTVIEQNLEMAARYDSDIEVWITEIGSPTDVMSLPTYSHDEIAARTMKVYALSTAMGLNNVFWYTYHDAEDPEDAEFVLSQYGLLYKNYTWKESAHAYSLFSEHCSNSILRTDLVRIQNNLMMNDVNAFLYRRPNGNSTLILWYEPTVGAQTSIRVDLALEGAASDILIHNIDNSENSSLEETDNLKISSDPVFITYNSDQLERDVSISSNFTFDAFTYYVWSLLPYLTMISGALLIFNMEAKKSKKSPNNTDAILVES